MRFLVGVFDYRCGLQSELANSSWCSTHSWCAGVGLFPLLCVHSVGLVYKVYVFFPSIDMTDEEQLRAQKDIQHSI